MAAEDRDARAYLSFAEQAAAEPRRFSLFALVRGLAARARGKPPVGRSRMPSQDVVRLRQIPHTHFPAPTLAEITLRDGRAEAAGYWLGLTGPMSPLPLHLTEFAAYERRYANKYPFGDFLDLIAGRFLQLFYRAWAVSQPAVEADRGDGDKFAGFIGALTGADEGAAETSLFGPTMRLHYAALFASRRSAGAIAGGLSHLLGLEVTLREFVPVLRDIHPDDQTRLGRQHHRLGEAVLGKRAYLVDDRFEVRITAPTNHHFRRLLPGGDLFPLAAEALDALAPSHLEWGMTLCLPQGEVKPTRLGDQSRLGWSSWIGTAQNDDIRDNVHLRRTSGARLGGRKT
ncbi:MAG: type VI secretion system baseplate subunit TssG [Porphyrobacter sp.]|nr:type VI secretion system baseplate subunit TssG [Porphyrobacter sp.]